MPLGPTSLTRRGLLGGLGGAAVLGLTVGRGAQATTGGSSVAGSPTAAAVRTSAGLAPRPNILLVVADDLGRGELGTYGQKTLRTRSLDDLAADGLRFDQAYANADLRTHPVLAVHRAAHRPLPGEGELPGLAGVCMPTTSPSARCSRRAGYTTALVGKWGLGPDRGHSPSHPQRAGLRPLLRLPQPTARPRLLADVPVAQRPTRALPGERPTEHDVHGDLITREALRFLDRLTPGSPFFLDVSYTTPHAPNAIPGATPYTAPDWPRGERDHAAQVTWTDTQVGLLLAGLAERGLSDNTVVVVISDNGPHGEGARYGHVGSHLPHWCGSSTATVRCAARKRSVHEGGIRIPLIVRVPPSVRTAGSPAPGTVVRTPVAVWDLLPTFADLAGGRTPRRIDGISFAPTLRGARQPGHDHLYWQYRGQRFGEAVRFGNWKAVRYDRGRVELYRIGRDPRERHDIARRHPAVARKAARLMHHAAA